MNKGWHIVLSPFPFVMNSFTTADNETIFLIQSFPFVKAVLKYEVNLSRPHLQYSWTEINQNFITAESYWKIFEPMHPILMITRAKETLVRPGGWDFLRMVKKIIFWTELEECGIWLFPPSVFWGESHFPAKRGWEPLRKLELESNLMHSPAYLWLDAQ